MGINLIPDNRKTRGCTWDDGNCVFYEIDSGQCSLLEDFDHWKAEACRQLKMCSYNFTADEMRCLLDERAKQQQQEIHDDIFSRYKKKDVIQSH